MAKEKKRKSPLKILLKTLLYVILVLLLAAAVLLVIPLTESPDTTSVAGSADWMAALPDDMGINEVVLPGTHDSGSKYVQLGFVTKCQSLTIGEQLDAGYRYLDVRLCVAGDRMKLTHSFANCKTRALGNDVLYLDNVLSQCYAFLDKHPTETVVFAVKQEYGDDAVADFETLLNGYVEKNPDYWLNSDTVPTLGEARGKLVLMRRYDDAANVGAASGIPLLWNDQGGFEDATKNTEENDNGSYTLWVQDRYEYSVDEKWTAFTEGMIPVEDNSVAINFLSTKGHLPVGHPYYFAKALNEKLIEAENLSGWVIIDFASAPLAQHIYDMNFTSDAGGEK